MTNAHSAANRVGAALAVKRSTLATKAVPTVFLAKLAGSKQKGAGEGEDQRTQCSHSVGAALAVKRSTLATKAVPMVFLAKLAGSKQKGAGEGEDQRTQCSQFG